MMFVAMFGRPRRNGSPFLRVLLIAAGVLLVLAAAGGLCAKCREHMACSAEGDGECCAEDDDREEQDEEEEVEEVEKQSDGA